MGHRPPGRCHHLSILANEEMIVDEYIVMVNGIELTVQGTAEDAKAHGWASKAKPSPANKARKPRNKASDSADAS